MARFIPYPDDQAINVHGDERWAYGGLELTNAFGWGLSRVGAARLQFNTATGHLEYSENGGPWTSFAGLASLIWTRAGTNIGPTVGTDSLTTGTGPVTVHGAFDLHCSSVTATTNPTINWGAGRIEDAGSVTLTPIGGGADDAPQIETALGQYKTVCLAPAAFNVQTSIDFPSNSHLVFAPKTVLTTNVATFALNGAYVVAGAGDTTLKTANVIGSRIINTMATIPVGTKVMVHNSTVPPNFRRLFYTTTAVAADGTGGFNVTLDRPCLMQFAVGDEVRPITSWTENVLIEGNGATIICTAGERVMNFTGSQRVILRDLTVKGTGAGSLTSVALSWDEGCFDCHGYDVRIISTDGAAIGDYGVAIESSEQCSWEHFYVERPADCGAEIDSGPGCVLRDFLIVNPGTHGVSVSSSDATMGCYDGVVERGTVVGAANAGVRVAGSAHRTLLRALHLDACQDGILLQASDETTIRDCSARNCTRAGVYVDTTPTRTAIDGFVAEGCVDGIYALADVNICNLRGLNNTRALQVLGTAVVNLDGFSITGATSYQLASLGTGALNASNGYVETGAGQNAIRQWGANTMRLSNVRLVAPGGGIGLFQDGANGTLICRDDVNTSGCTVPAYITGATSKLWRDGPPVAVTLAGGATAAQLNWGTVTCNGTTEVDTPNLWITGAADTKKPVWGLGTIDAAHAPQLQPYEDKARAAGHLYTKAQTADDASVWTYRLEE